MIKQMYSEKKEVMSEVERLTESSTNPKINMVQKLPR